MEYNCSIVKTENVKSKIVFKPTFARLIASGLGSGELKPAPGTWGTIACIVLLWVFQPDQVLLILLWLGTLPLAHWATSVSMEHYAEHDPGWIVVDEWQGVCITWIMVMPRSALAVFTVFLTFRLFDVFKPYPIGAMDRQITGAAGVLADDWIAGLYAGMVSYLFLAAY